LNSSLFILSEEVKHALATKAPIVALESTIISHGMPYPDNIETALSVENILREQGVVPATIALHQGKIHIGLNEAIMMHLATKPDIFKASRRDLAYAISHQLSASTTVAATMFIAHAAGIQLFVTGGIGGVHPGLSEYFDISADLMELGQTPVTVICAGAKSILDLPKTLEVLETQGVPVIGYQTDVFPAFYNRESALKLTHREDTPEAIAKFIQIQQALNLKNGLLVANPIPKDASLADEDIYPFIEQAQLEATAIKGKDITPFLLKRINELTEGKSLKANVALIKNNALLGGKIAKCLFK